VVLFQDPNTIWMHIFKIEKGILFCSLRPVQYLLRIYKV
jgi:hypothetical protein